ncbi:MAG: phosphodiesterase [Actinobacteria bacterium 69-20]|nr:dNTP triphosphohydrolase [Actinomycetota bacterium]OJV30321.1 MAG: phosphodiesterase [Actinobacteria bacterium 69-20]
MDPRLARRSDNGSRGSATAGAFDAAEMDAATEGAFRDDLERIRFSPYFARLAAVTQVVNQGSAGQVVHNRLTHTVKVTAVARAIATLLRDRGDMALIDRLGGCDPVVVQAAASAHDLGHPPFGHLGERILDRIARSRFGLIDGFEGNAQTFRILTTLDVHGEQEHGLDLTAAVRAAVLKYPWARTGFPTPHPSEAAERPKGAAPGPEGAGSLKFSAYVVDVPELIEVRRAYPQIGPWQQTVECSVMDLADDIAYSLHDLDDFHRAGVLQHASVAAEFRTWMRLRATLSAMSPGELQGDGRRPGHSLELLRRRLHAKDAWIVDDEVFATAVERVGDELVDGLLAVPFDSSIAAERAVGLFTATWISHLQDSVTTAAAPPVRAAHVLLTQQAWHEVAVLKFVHQRFVLDRPDLALLQRGQARLLAALVRDLESWLTDPIDVGRAPRRLLDLVRLATDDYREVARSMPQLLIRPTGEPATSADDLARLGRGRGIIDYVASLTDDRAVATAAALSGHAGQLWSAGSAL